MIVAIDDNFCIGKDGHLLARIPEDMKFFKETTQNKVVIMGKNTQESLPNGLYLKDRINIIISKKLTIDAGIYLYDDTIVYYASNIDEIYDFINEINDAYASGDNIYNNLHINDEDVFVIGGGQTYKYFLDNDLIDKVYITHIYHSFEGDTYIPNISDYGFKQSTTISPVTKSETGYDFSIDIYKK